MSGNPIPWSSQKNVGVSNGTPATLRTTELNSMATMQFLVSLSYNDTYDSVTDSRVLFENRDNGQVMKPYGIIEMTFISLIAALLSIVTVIGNIMVMISFKMDKQLQTISNYFLLSLAVADFSIGLISMPLFTMYLLLGTWPLGDIICDTWLAFDYLNSNASVLNLLIISFDRYFSVTRPLTYRALRTTKRAAVMIASAWLISLMLWPPWIYSWPYIEGRRTVKKNQCYIQFLETNSYVTFGTALAAFYVPVTVMFILYWRIWRETEQRQKDLSQLQAGKKEDSHKSTSSEDPQEPEENRKVEDCKRTCPDSGVLEETMETTYVPTSLCVETSKYLPKQKKSKPRKFADVFCNLCKVDHETEPTGQESTSHGSPATTPASLETPMQSISRTASLNFRVDHVVQIHPSQSLPSTSQKMSDHAIPLTERNCPRRLDVKQSEAKHHVSKSQSRSSFPGSTLTTVLPTSPGSQPQAETNLSLPTSPQDMKPISTHPASPTTQTTITAATVAAEEADPVDATDSVYTVLIRLPKKNPSSDGEGEGHTSIKMIMEEDETELSADAIETLDEVESSESGLRPNTEGTNGRQSLEAVDPSVESIRLPLNTKLVHKQVVKHHVPPKRKRKQQERRQEMKAAKTLSAILLAFTVTWTPYNVLVLYKTLTNCEDDGCISQGLWNFAYYLCYINSTVNPFCYALCNANFRKTYMRILSCKWHNKKSNMAHRGNFS